MVGIGGDEARELPKVWIVGGQVGRSVSCVGDESQKGVLERLLTRFSFSFHAWSPECFPVRLR